MILGINSHIYISQSVLVRNNGFIHTRAQSYNPFCKARVSSHPFCHASQAFGPEHLVPVVLYPFMASTPLIFTFAGTDDPPNTPAPTLFLPHKAIPPRAVPTIITFTQTRNYLCSSLMNFSVLLQKVRLYLHSFY